MCFSNVHLSYLLQEDKSLTIRFFVPCFDVMNSDSTSSSPSFFLFPQQWTTHLTHTNHNLRNCVFDAGENGCQKPSPLLLADLLQYSIGHHHLVLTLSICDTHYTDRPQLAKLSVNKSHEFFCTILTLRQKMKKICK